MAILTDWTFYVLYQVKQEKELALAKLKQVAAERDAAVKEMREMADQCKAIADEFETMAGQYEKILKGNYIPHIITIKRIVVAETGYLIYLMIDILYWL